MSAAAQQQQQQIQQRTRIGNYEIGKTLGEGTFAKVKYGRHVDTGASFAIKIIDKDKILKHKMVQQVQNILAPPQVLHELFHQHLVVFFLFFLLCPSWRNKKTKTFLQEMRFSWRSCKQLSWVQLVENLDEELRLLLHHQEIIIIFLQNMIFHEENQIAQNFTLSECKLILSNVKVFFFFLFVF